MRKILLQFSLLLAAFLATGCSDLFDYHPYDVRIEGTTGINATNISRIEEACKTKDTVVVAVVSDSHGWYSDTRDAVTSINANPSIDFIIHCGDLTDCGTTKEFMWQRDILQQLRKPYVALIGNHDFLGTGDEVYEEMFGAMDFSFVAGKVRFVCVNTNAAEYDYMAAVPNLDFIESFWKADTLEASRTIVCMHARPYSEQFNNNAAKAFEHYITQLPSLMFCIFGHGHGLEVSDVFGDGVLYYEADATTHRHYLLFTITPKDYAYEVVSF